MVCVAQFGLVTEKSVGETMVNSLRERVTGVVVPPIVGNETSLERLQRLWSGVVDFLLEAGPDVPEREQIVISEELENRVDQDVAKMQQSVLEG